MEHCRSINNIAFFFISSPGPFWPLAPPQKSFLHLVQFLTVPLRWFTCTNTLPCAYITWWLRNCKCKYAGHPNVHKNADATCLLLKFNFSRMCIVIPSLAQLVTWKYFSEARLELNQDKIMYMLCKCFQNKSCIVFPFCCPLGNVEEHIAQYFFLTSFASEVSIMLKLQPSSRLWRVLLYATEKKLETWRLPVRTPMPSILMALAKRDELCDKTDKINSLYWLAGAIWEAAAKTCLPLLASAQPKAFYLLHLRAMNEDWQDPHQAALPWQVPS